MRSYWSCNTDGENLGCSWADYDPSHLQKCWLRTPDSITSDRIWSRYQNEGLLDQRNSPPGSHDPRCQSSKKRQIDDKNWYKNYYRRNTQRRCKPISTPLQADYNTVASRLKGRLQADSSRRTPITRTIASWLQRRLQSDIKDDYKQIEKTITSWSKRRLQADQRDNYKQMSKPWRADTEAIHNRKL